MIKSLKYYVGMGLRPESKYPEDLSVAVSLEGSQLTKRIRDSFEEEKITELYGIYGAETGATPVEVDRLEVKTNNGEIAVTVLNRGIILLMSENEEVKRLHRFFCTLRDELG